VSPGPCAEPISVSVMRKGSPCERARRYHGPMMDRRSDSWLRSWDMLMPRRLDLVRCRIHTGHPQLLEIPLAISPLARLRPGPPSEFECAAVSVSLLAANLRFPPWPGAPRCQFHAESPVSLSDGVVSLRRPDANWRG